LKSGASLVRLGALLLLLAAAITSIVLPSLRSASSPGTPHRADAEFSAIDPRLLVPQAADLPRGTSVSSFAYVSSAQAARRNDTPLPVLQQFGREIGYTRDFQVPRYGDIEVDVVRYRTIGGLARAYAYFLGLPARVGSHPVSLRGLGDRASLVLAGVAGFVEFRRGRYYIVITAVPITAATLTFIGRLSKQVDRNIRTYRLST